MSRYLTLELPKVPTDTNTARFYSSMGNPSGVKGLTILCQLLSPHKQVRVDPTRRPSLGFPTVLQGYPRHVQHNTPLLRQMDADFQHAVQSVLITLITSPSFRVGEECWIHASTLCVSVYIHHYSPPLRGIVAYQYLPNQWIAIFARFDWLP